MPKQKWIKAVLRETAELMEQRVPRCSVPQLREELLEIMPRGEHLSLPALYNYLALDKDRWMEPRDTIGVAVRQWNEKQRELL